MVVVAELIRALLSARSAATERRCFFFVAAWTCASAAAWTFALPAAAALVVAAAAAVAFAAAAAVGGHHFVVEVLGYVFAPRLRLPLQA